MENLLIMLEILNEQAELRNLGLTEEEIDGYIEFYWGHYKIDPPPEVQ